MACEERDRLLREYQTAIENLTRLVLALKDSHGPDYKQAHDEVDAASAVCEKARGDLWEHWQKHGC